MAIEQISFNDEALSLETPVTVTEFLSQQSQTGRFVVVINDQVVSASAFDEKQINAGDRVEILSPISGG